MIKEKERAHDRMQSEYSGLLAVHLLLVYHSLLNCLDPDEELQKFYKKFMNQIEDVRAFAIRAGS